MAVRDRDCPGGVGAGAERSQRNKNYEQVKNQEECGNSENRFVYSKQRDSL